MALDFNLGLSKQAVGELLRRAKKGSRFSPGSIARILPAFFVGLFPFTVFDGILLEAHYELRGPRQPDTRYQVVVSESRDEIPSLLALAARLGTPRCILISSINQTNSKCKLIDLTGRFTEADIKVAVLDAPQAKTLALHQGPALNHETLYYGPLPAFRPVEGSLALRRGAQLLQNAETLVILDNTYVPKILVPTPAGPMTQGEVALNVLLNNLDGTAFRTLPEWTSFVYSASLALLTAWLLYAYPVLLTFIFVVILGSLAFVISLMLFDRFGLHLPLAAGWSSMLAVLFLGMADRLDKRERREWALEQAAESLKNLDEMRNNFLSLVSHDLKTPVAKIMAMLDRFARGEFGQVSPEQKSNIDRLLSASGYLQRTISTLLLLGRIESGEFNIHRMPTDLTDLLDAAIRQNSPAARERGITIDKELEPLFLVDMDRDLILQVAMNLIENALKYSPPHTRVLVRSGEMENCVELSPPQPGVWFEVQDEGPGIRPGDRERVFHKFARGSNESTAADQSVKGTGLGLYLSQFFIEKHGGRLILITRTMGEKTNGDLVLSEYFTESQNGTVFRVILPIDPPVIEAS
jgi:signal transduction histidine kinase